MKDRIIIFLVFTLLVISPFFVQPVEAQSGEGGRIPDFISATTKKGAEKIAALNAYVKKYPEPGQKWTKLAYYNLAVAYFQANKFKETVTAAEHTLKIGTSAKEEEARLLLVLSNSYAIKSSPVFNQGKATSYANKAISFAKKYSLPKILKNAEELKSKLSTKTVKLTPEQEIKKNYVDEDFQKIVNFYNKLPHDKRTTELRKIYAQTLFKMGRLDAALKEFDALLAETGDPYYAVKLASTYGKKASRNKKFRDKATQYYLKAHWIYKKNKEAAKSQSALKNARFQLNQKYEIQKFINAVNTDMGNRNDSKAKKEAEIRRLKKKLRDMRKQKRREYSDIAPPQWFTDDYEKTMKALEDAQRGGTVPTSSKAYKKLEEARKQVEDELKRLLAETKS